MFPYLASACLVVAVAWSTRALLRRVALLFLAVPNTGLKFDRPLDRVRRVLRDAVLQRRLTSERWPGLAHLAIFYGFWLMLPRTIVLVGRAFDARFAFDAHGGSLALVADAYSWVKSAAALLVVCGVCVFAYLRIAPRATRLRRTSSALWILVAIAVMMLADFLYEAAGICLARRMASAASPWESGHLAYGFVAPFLPGDGHPIGGRLGIDPVTRLAVSMFSAFCEPTLLVLGLLGYALHVMPVLGMLALLPASKHRHLIAAWPNLFFDGLRPIGKPSTVATSADQLLEGVEKYLQRDVVGPSVASPLGKASLGDFTAKDRLSWLACTECGRCTSHCPATRSGGPLDPRQLTLKLRDRLEQTPLDSADARGFLERPLIPEVLSADAIWACTNCGACEEQCPVGVRYVEPIVDLRRDLLLMRGEAPPALQRLFDGLERQGNPWNLPSSDRARWAKGLDVPLLRDVAHVEYLYWVGCAASFDGRGQAVARAMVRLMKKAQIDFAILGAEERCTGDAARRAGNELLYLQLAEHNTALLKTYRAQGRFSRIITTCPHCLTALGTDYAELGAYFDVVPHSVAIEQWLAEGRLELASDRSVEPLTYHDPCTLARSCGVTESPRRVLESLSRAKVREPQHHGRHTACCGAGGARMWLDASTATQPSATTATQPSVTQPSASTATQPSVTQPSALRIDELSRTNVGRVVSACPFCSTMLRDAAHRQSPNQPLEVEDLAEIVDRWSKS